MASAPFAIAIVGRACVLPGALSPEQLWQAVAEGRDLVDRVEEGRWRLATRDVLGRPEQPDGDRTWTDRGGYVRGFERVWDPEGFAIPAAELAGLDPLFHWLLHTARAALADAGDDRRGAVDRSRVGAVFGNLGFPTVEMSRHAESVWFGGGSRVDPRNRFMGGGAAALLERALGLAPGVFCLDTACASSLYAIKLACDQLRDGQVDLALAGAVNRADDLFLHVGFCALDAMSRTGRSRPFHAEADGLVPAEGAGFVALERLADARRLGHRIHGIIRGVGLSNDGRGRGFLAPSEAGQRRAIQQAYAIGEVDPRRVSLLECHATGTVVGDTTELRSSAAIFSDVRELAIGSLKSNLGHAITVAGVAGLIKVLEAMRHGQRPASLHADALNPALADTPFRVVRALEPWVADGSRIAGISAFGFGGNNAHLVVSEDDVTIDAEASMPSERDEPLAIVGIGARVGSALGVPAFERALLTRASLVEREGACTRAFELELAGLRFPPNDLRRTLPQQLLVLAAAREAMAGIASHVPERGGVFLATEVDPEICRYGARWRVPERLRDAGGDPEREREWIAEAREGITPKLVAAGVIGTMPNIPANRINAQFDLGGPSWTVFEGERSGSRALELAVRALRRGELDTALVCGVDMSCQGVHVEALAAIEGRPSVPGDAAVVLVLRRLADARRSGERVLAILDAGSRQAADPQLDLGVDEFGLRERLGRCWAAGDLRELGAAVIAGRRGALPDGRAWSEPRHMHVVARPGATNLRLRPSPPIPELIRFAAANEAELDRALATGRLGGDGPCRAAIVASNPAELDARIARARRHLHDGTPTGPGVFVRRRPIAGELAWVFNGAGAAYPGMGDALLDALPAIRRSLAEHSPGLAACYDAPWTDATEVEPLQRLWASSYLSQAHARISSSLLGLRPRAVIGYSSGESNSLFATGIWSDHDAMIAACRDSGVFTREIGGELRAVARAWGVPTAAWETWTVLAPIPDILAALEGETRAHLSVVHHDNEGIVSGDPDPCARVRAKLGPSRCLRLHYDLAVHVPELGEIAEAWLDIHRRPVAPRNDLRVYSGAHAGPYTPSSEACAQAILGQANRRLDFRGVIERAWADGVRVFVEQGPQAGCSRWIREILGERDAVVVALDRKGAGIDPILEAAAALYVASVECTPDVLLDALRGRSTSASPSESATLTFEAHPPLRVLSRASERSDSAMQAMPPAPILPPVDAIAPALGLPMQASAPSPTVIAQAPAPMPASASSPFAAAFQAQLAELGRRQREFVEQQAALHQQFLDLRQRSLGLLMDVATGSRASTAQPIAAPAPVPTRPTPPPIATPAIAAAPPQPPKPAPKPEPAAKPEPQTAAAGPRTPIGPTFDRAALEVHASGAISQIFGPGFAPQDPYVRQVRMPMPPLLLADRVTGLDAEPLSMKLGTIWTETDVRPDAWYLHAGRMPAGIMIESGQADLMLISWLGVDAENRGERVYRLLGCTLTYHGSLPAVGETLCYDIHLDGHAKQGATRLMFFHYDCHIAGKLRLSVRKGQAGFFTDAELANSDGCLWRPEDQKIVAEPRLDPPAARTPHDSFGPDRVAAFAAGRPWDCFGEPWAMAKPHTRTPRISGGRMLFFDRVDRFEVRGGPWDRGYLEASTTIHPDHWFFAGHFHNDPCMPGTLMFEGCLQAMAFFLAGLGYTIAHDGWRFEPVEGEPFVLSCRGQVTPTSKQLRYEVFVEEVIAGPIPTVYADLLCTVDGLKAFHARRVGLRLVPAWPLDEGSVLLDGYVEPGPVARAGSFAFDYRSMLACANGRPTEAFGPIYQRFDGVEPVARLPNPPYHFITRALHVDGQIGELRSGMGVEVEYDIPPDAWYFAENGCRTMPFAVLLEAALQPCGWLASYMGCALSSSDSLMFRNLDGTGTLHAELLPTAGPLRTKVKNTKLSKTPSMIIVGFDVECRVDDTLVYSMDTVFGFFPASAFENQAGLPTTAEQRALFDAPSERTWPLDGSRSTPGRARMARPMLLMLDRVTLFEPDAGRAGLGRARAEKDVDPGEWFFKAHFFQDPVQPGSLGIEAMIQLLQWTMLELGMDAGMAAPRFEPIALGDALTWKYRGQVVPTNKRITTTLEITERGHDERGRFVRAVASLWVDGKRIYEASGLGMRIVDGGAGDGRHTPLDPDRDTWLRDHCPTWTLPALPMMSMVDLLAQAARSDERLIGLRDVRVKGWMVCDRAIDLRCERAGDHVRLLLDTPDSGEREVASARLLVGNFGEPPSPLPALLGPQVPLPYDDGSLFHGPAFQLLDSLIRTRAGASSTLRASSAIPLGRLNPGLLDGATHGIPHDHLNEWNDRLSPDKVAYPAWIPELELFGPTPTTGTLRCEVRPAGVVGSVDFPAFEIQIIHDDASHGPKVWCRMRLVEACFPKGRLGSATPIERRAFLRDHRAVPGLALAEVGPDSTTLIEAELADSDWLPGTIAGIYGTRDENEVARKEHIAAAHGVHPRHVPEALPLTRFDLALERDAPGHVRVRGSARGTLDISPVREFWTQWFARGRWPVEDLYYGLIERFLARVVLADPAAFAAIEGRSVLFLANHQVGVESLLFSILASGLGRVPTVTLAKIEHKTTWLGRLIDHCFAYPGIRDPKLITFFDRDDKTSLVRIIAELAAEMRGPGRSVMVHVEGTRSLSCAQPVEKMSGAFLDMAIAVGAPVVPVRFIGGLPVEPLEQRLEFPVGMGRQDIWIGRPIAPEQLARVPYGERKQQVVAAINGLGPSNADERPFVGDPAFAAKVARWQAQRGVSHEHAVLHEVLAECPDPCAATRELLAASDAAALERDGSPEGVWLAELGRRLLG
jgi:acyl transferase domain-containing protein/3-hydroxymyristoyl/3-hydroxydecanoyl-(acyl carrier protein) dehydratase/1-acyl-sn-glycerol-3-phosphate acyltransferase